MIKRKIIETVREFDDEGRVTKESIIETFEDDDSQYQTDCPGYPAWPWPRISPASLMTQGGCQCKE